MARSKATIQALEQRFAACIAKGMTQSDAYRVIKPRCRKWKAEAVGADASRFANRPTVVAAIKAALDAAGVADLYSIGRWTADALLLRQKAVDEGNLNAAQAIQRQLGQAIKALGGEIVINQYDKADDAAVIERLAKGDPKVAAMLAKLAGKPGFDA